MAITDAPSPVIFSLHIFVSECLPSAPFFFSGHDLNRRWLKPDPALHPEIVAFKVPPALQYLPIFITKHQVLFCCFFYLVLALPISEHAGRDGAGKATHDVL